MKQKQLKTPPAHTSPLVPVRFEYTHPNASAVSVAGAFNDWHPTNKSLQPRGDGHWLKETTLEAGTYEYCLVVDGQWMPDPMTTDYVPKPFGGMNSLLHCRNAREASRLPLSKAPGRGTRQ